MRRNIPLLLLVAFCFVITSCRAQQPRERRSVPPTKIGQPLLDFSRGWGGIPIAGAIDPSDPQSLQLAATVPLTERLQGVADDAVTVEGRSLGKLRRLTIDISSATVNADYRPRSLKEPSRPVPLLRVDHFEYRAAPLLYQGGSTYSRIVARDASFAQLTDSDGSQVLVMTDAADGFMTFSVPLSDFASIARSASSRHAGRLRLTDLIVNFSSEHPRNLIADIELAGWWILLPMRFKMHCRIDINDEFQVQLSDITVNGQDVGGVLLAGIIEAALRKFETELRPLAYWPENRVRVTDVRIAVTDELVFFASFARSSKP